METERRRQILLAMLAVVLAIVAYQAWPRTSQTQAAASNRTGRAQAGAGARGGPAAARSGPAAGAAQAGSEAPDVHLEALSDERPKPGGADRNLFRFKPKPPPPAPPQPVQPLPVPVAPVPTGPPPPAPPPPIALKFIGVIARTETGAPKIAALADATGHVFHGVEGQAIAGQYRILKIGEESIEMAYLDGRGRQTIRLTGS
jgi:hypothetical protein